MAAPEIDIVKATVHHAWKMAPHMRQADVLECRASGGYEPLEALDVSLRVSTAAYALMVGGEVACLFGVAPVPSDTILGAGDVGIVWLLGTTVIDRHPRAFLRLCRPVLRELFAYFPVLVNAIDARYISAIRWARWLGFEVQSAVDWGFEHRPFHFITARRGHV